MAYRRRLDLGDLAFSNEARFQDILTPEDLRGADSVHVIGAIVRTSGNTSPSVGFSFTGQYGDSSRFYRLRADAPASSSSADAVVEPEDARSLRMSWTTGVVGPHSFVIQDALAIVTYCS